MTGLGDRLKEARTAKGFTLDDLQSITKIQKRYLSGIENEDYSMMPGSFYVRAFIKQYAEAVGLDSEEMLFLYKDSAPVAQSADKENQLVQPALNRRSMSKRSNQFAQMMPKITVALFIIVIIVIAYLLIKDNASKQPPIKNIGEQEPISMQEGKKPDVGKTDGVPDEEDQGDGEPDKVVEPEKPLQTLTHSSINGQLSTYSLTGADGFVVEIRTADNSWIGVLDGSQKERMTPSAREMKAGETVELDVSDTDSVRIRVGYAPSTEIYVNGELLDYASERTPQTIAIEYVKEE